MNGRDFLIAFERELQTVFLTYNVTDKLTVDQIMYYINKSKDEYVKQLYRVFQQNQEISDNLRQLVDTVIYSKPERYVATGNRTCHHVEYPADYLFGLSESVFIQLVDNKCDNLLTKASGIIEATLENLNSILDNSLSEYHLHHNQAKPVRVYTDKQILLYTDGNYEISEYVITFLKKPKKISATSTEEYVDLPSNTHNEIVSMAVRDYLSLAATSKAPEKSSAN